MKLSFNDFVEFAKNGVTEDKIKKIIELSSAEELAFEISDLFRLKNSIKNISVNANYNIPYLKLIYNFEQKENKDGDNIIYFDYSDIFDASDCYLSRDDLKEFQKEFFITDGKGKIQQWVSFREVGFYHLEDKKQDAIFWLELRIHENANVTVLMDKNNNVVVAEY